MAAGSASCSPTDVVFCSPHLTVESLASLQQALGSPEDSLTDIGIVVVALDAVEDKVICEWRLEAMFTRPVLYDDRLLIEPTGGAVRLPGASFAEFREHRIRSFRHYFDDTELLAGRPRHPEPPALVVRRLIVADGRRHPRRGAASSRSAATAIAIGAASRRRAQLAVDGDRLRLHGVARDVQAIGDLGDRQVGGQQPQHS